MRNSKENQWQVAKLSLRFIQDPGTRLKATTSRKSQQIFLSMWEKDDLYVEEHLAAIFLNLDKEVIGYRLLAIGGLSYAKVSIGSIVKFALMSHCSYVILAHNHPSGNVRKSVV